MRKPNGVDVQRGMFPLASLKNKQTLKKGFKILGFYLYENAYKTVLCGEKHFVSSGVKPL